MYLMPNLLVPAKKQTSCRSAQQKRFVSLNFLFNLKQTALQRSHVVPFIKSLLQLMCMKNFLQQITFLSKKLSFHMCP